MPAAFEAADAKKFVTTLVKKKSKITKRVVIPQCVLTSVKIQISNWRRLIVTSVVTCFRFLAKISTLTKLEHPYLVLKPFPSDIVGLVRSVKSKSETFIKEKRKYKFPFHFGWNYEIWTNFKILNNFFSVCYKFYYLDPLPPPHSLERDSGGLKCSLQMTDSGLNNLRQKSISNSAVGVRSTGLKIGHIFKFWWWPPQIEIQVKIDEILKTGQNFICW